MSNPASSEQRTDANSAEDLQFLRRAQGGDWEAFQEIVNRFQARIFALAMRILGQRQDAEDVTQQTFLSLIEHLDQFREESSVATWILRIATNHALKILRKRRGLPTIPLENYSSSEDSYANLPHPDYIAQWKDDPADLAERAEVRAVVEHQLAELDEKYRIVFVLRDIEGLSIRETADLLELSEANVKVRLLRARLLLRERLTKTFGDEATRVIPDHDHQ